MPKLATPVQYEPVLDGLNELRPLILDNTVRRVIGVPVSPVDVSDTSGGVKGRLLRCNRQGALLRENNHYEPEYQSISISWSAAGGNRVVTFDQRVNYIAYRWVVKSGLLIAARYDSTFTYFLGWLVLSGNNFIPFRGTAMGFVAAFFPGGYATMNIRGFY